MGNKAIIVGGTGLIGSFVIQYLTEDDFFDEVIVLNRREVKYDSPKIRQVVADFDNLSQTIKDFKPTHAFCTLGTTIKKAGSKEAFRKVDFEYVLNFAQAVFQSGCKNFSVVTALGTNKKSPIFYNQVKYEVTQALEQIGFDRLNILQPSLLLGERNEQRLGEDISQALFGLTKKLWTGPLKNYAGIQGSQVAKAMITISKDSASGVHRYPSGMLQEY